MSKSTFLDAWEVGCNLFQGCSELVLCQAPLRLCPGMKCSVYNFRTVLLSLPFNVVYMEVLVKVRGQKEIKSFFQAASRDKVRLSNLAQRTFTQ